MKTILLYAVGIVLGLLLLGLGLVAKMFFFALVFHFAGMM